MPPLAQLGSSSHGRNDGQSRPLQHNLNWDLVLRPNKDDLVKETQGLAAKGLLFWKGRGAVAPELAPAEDAVEAEEVEEEEEEDDEVDVNLVTLLGTTSQQCI
eukprot:958055-Amphidinium_carterae.1